MKNWQDWYQVRMSKITKLGLNKALEPYQGSLVSALLDVYPEHDWKPWKFEHIHCPASYWRKFEHQKIFFDELSMKLGIKELGI